MVMMAVLGVDQLIEGLAVLITNHLHDTDLLKGIQAAI